MARSRRIGTAVSGSPPGVYCALFTNGAMALRLGDDGQKIAIPPCGTPRSGIPETLMFRLAYLVSPNERLVFLNEITCTHSGPLGRSPNRAF